MDRFSTPTFSLLVVYYIGMDRKAMTDRKNANEFVIRPEGTARTQVVWKHYYFITAGMVVERKPCVRGKMSENAMRRSKATACML